MNELRRIFLNHSISPLWPNRRITALACGNDMAPATIQQHLHDGVMVDIIRGNGVEILQDHLSEFRITGAIMAKGHDPFGIPLLTVDTMIDINSYPHAILYPGRRLLTFYLIVVHGLLMIINYKASKKRTLAIKEYCQQQKTAA